MDLVADIIRDLLPELDETPSREGLSETPERYARFMAEFLSPKPLKFTTFQNEGYNEMVVQSQVPFYSLCEHHLLPFFGHGTLAYIPNSRIVGLSKLARTLEHFSSQLQNQERITMQVGDYIQEQLAAKGVGVIITARHLCMEMRGIKKPGTTTATSYLTGIFKSRPATRQEFLRLAQ